MVNGFKNYVHFAGGEARKLYEEAMTRGYIESDLALLILVGVMGSGKSEFKRLVLGLPVPEFSASTPLAKSSVRSMSICQVAVDGEGPVEWRTVTPSDMIDIVTGAINRARGVPVVESSLASSMNDLCQLALTSSILEEVAVERLSTKVSTYQHQKPSQLQWEPSITQQPNKTEYTPTTP